MIQKNLLKSIWIWFILKEQKKQTEYVRRFEPNNQKWLIN